MKITTQELFKKKSTKFILAGVAAITTLATIAVISLAQTKTTALKETSPFYATSYIDRMFYVEGRGDLTVAVLRKYDGTDNGPLGWCLNKDKTMPGTTSIPYESSLGEEEEWKWELQNGNYPTDEQVAAVQRTLYGYQFLFKNVLPDFGLESTDNMSLYHANQLAIWSILENWTPDQVLIKDEVKSNPEMYELAQKIHALYTRMYNYGMDDSNLTYVNGIKVVYDNTNDEVSQITLNDDDYVQGTSMGYYRTKLIEAVPKQSYGYYYDGEYAFTYKVSLENAPEGARIVNENGEPQDTFSTKPGVGLEFYVEVPASATGSGTFTVKVETTSFRRSSPVLWTPVTDTAYQAIIQNVTLPDSDTKSFTVSYSNTTELGSLTINKVAEQPSGSTVQDTEYGKLYTISYADQPLQGATFDLFYKYDDLLFTGTDGMEYFDGDKVKQDSLTTNESGKVIFDSIPLNADEDTTEFTIKETSTKTGYIISQSEYETMIDNTDTLSNAVNIKNNRVKIDFSFTKLRETTNGNIPLEGAAFGVYTSQQIADIPKDALVGLITSDENGIVSGKSLDLPINYQFYIKELKTDDELSLDTNVYTIDTTINSDTTIKDGYATVSVKDSSGNTVQNITNKMKRGSLYIVKQEERFDSESKSFIFQTITDPSNYEFKIFSDKAKRNLVAILNKDNFEDGRFVANNLVSGTYYVVETSSNPMFVMSEETYEINLDVNAENTIVIENKVDTFDVKIYKKDSTRPNDIKPIENVKFNLIHDGTVLYTAVTDSDGVALFENVKRGITYEVVEHVPAGYRAPTENLIIETDTVNRLWEGTVYNELSNKLGNIEVQKVDSETGNALANATIGIYREADTEYQSPIKIDTTDDEGKIVFTDLSLDENYIIHETVAPNGYLLTEDIKVDMSEVEHGDTVQVIMEDDKYYGNIKIVKYDSSTNDYLSGATFALYDENMEMLEEGTSNENGEIVFSNYEAGDYYVVETEAPKGYRLNEEPISVHLNETMNEGVVIEAYNEPISVSLKIVKVDNDNRNILIPGTEFEVYDAEDTELENVLYSGATDESGQILFENIPAKKYLVVETKAAEGYEMMTRSIMVDLTDAEDGAVATLTVYNKKIETPIDVDPDVKPDPEEPEETPEAPDEEVPSEAIVPVDPEQPVENEEIPEDSSEPQTPTLEIKIPDTGVEDNTAVWMIAGLTVIAIGIISLAVILIRKKKSS